MADDVIKAAGGIVIRRRGFRDEVLIIHRRRYDDWTLPKGKLEAGESAASAARREVREETGVVARLDWYIGTVAYPVNGQTKVVDFWRMSVEADHPLEPNEEVASRMWLPLRQAIKRLTHPVERELLRVLSRRPAGGSAATVGWVRQWMRWTFFNGRARSRLEREHRLLEISSEELVRRSTARLPAATSEPSWAKGTRERLAEVRHHLDEDDEEAGWRCLKAAQRSLMAGLDPAELDSFALSLREETEKKMGGWRRRAILKLLGDDAPGAPKPGSEIPLARLVAAAEHRDEHDDNAYLRLGLMSDQLGMLFWTAIVPPIVLLLAYFVVARPRFETWNETLHVCASDGSCDRWTPWMVVAVMMFGVLGATFSIVYSIISTPKSSIPRLSDKYITIIRSWCGAIAALAGHAIVAAQLIKVEIGANGPSTWLALAFIFGCAGERLISRVVETIAGKPDSPTGDDDDPIDEKRKGGHPDTPRLPDTPPQPVPTETPGGPAAGPS